MLTQDKINKIITGGMVYNHINEYFYCLSCGKKANSEFCDDVCHQNYLY